MVSVFKVSSSKFLSFLLVLNLSFILFGNYNCICWYLNINFPIYKQEELHSEINPIQINGLFLETLKTSNNNNCFSNVFGGHWNEILRKIG